MLYGPLNSLSPSTWNGLSSLVSNEELFLKFGLQSECSLGEKALADDEVGDERPWFVSGGSQSLQYIAAMHLIISSESLFGVSGTWSDMLAPRYSARLITLVALFWAYCNEPFRIVIKKCHSQNFTLSDLWSFKWKVFYAVKKKLCSIFGVSEWKRMDKKNRSAVYKKIPF